jgi:hypothetical protein
MRLEERERRRRRKKKKKTAMRRSSYGRCGGGRWCDGGARLYGTGSEQNGSREGVGLRRGGFI